VKKCVILLAKSPAYGKVKTRLAIDIGNDKALNIYTLLLQNQINSCIKSDYPTSLFCPPETDSSFFDKYFNDIHTQQGKNLGMRMANAFISIFSERYEKAVLTGGDIPDMTSEHIEESLNALDKSDSVITPANDGGYCLIGFNKNSFSKSFFEKINWSTETVFEETCRKIYNNNSSLHINKVLADIDDLKSLNEYLTSSSSVTAEKIREILSYDSI